MEYYAALAPWATFNTNRSKESPFMSPLEFTLRRNHRLTIMEKIDGGGDKRAAPAAGQINPPAAAPANGKMRFAKPGERPPSKYAPGENDNVIDRYDAWVRQYKQNGGKVKRRGNPNGGRR